MTSEQYVQGLCKNNFLQLWAYPNPSYLAKSVCKELCDVLVIFENHIIIISDKSSFCKEPSKENWQRWVRCAVTESARQVNGAENSLLRHPDKIFEDRSCKKALPIKIPNNPKIHRLLTCRGAKEACQKHFDGGSGTLSLYSGPFLSENIFEIGCLDKNNKFFHIFHESTIATVFRTLDTISDFIFYLKEREKFFHSSHCTKVIFNEQEFLSNHLYQEGYLQAKKQIHHSEQNIFPIKKEDFILSHFWDYLIEKFITHFNNKTHFFSTTDRIIDLEPSIRFMARENRFRRCVLVGKIFGMSLIPNVQIQVELVPPNLSGDPHWVFLVFDRRIDESYENFRCTRLKILGECCEIVRYLNNSALDIVGIAVESIKSSVLDGNSADFCYFNGRNWSDERHVRGQELFEKYGAFFNYNGPLNVPPTAPSP